MQIEIITAFVGLVGVIIGISAQYVFSKQIESMKHYQELRTKSYIDFIKSTAMISIAQKDQNADKEFDGRILMADTKARIAIYGSPEVAHLAAYFFRQYGALTSPEAYVSYVAIVSGMRADTSGGEIAIPNNDIGQLILSEDVK